MRGVLFVLLLAIGCRTSEIARDHVSAIAPVSASVSVAETPPPPPPPAPPPATDPTNDDVAALVLRDYDRATHRVQTTAVDAGVGVGTAIDVVASSGDVLHTFVDPSLGTGGVHVEQLRGEDWASGKILAWVVVGTQPGLCGIAQGFIALLAGKSVVALAPWDGSCGPSYHASFATVQARGVVLEEQGGSGEDGVSEESNRVWIVAGPRLKQAGEARRSFEETWTHAIAGTTRKMDSTLACDPTGLLVTERWQFTSDATQKTKNVTRVLRYTLRGDSLVVPTRPDPTP